MVGDASSVHPVTEILPEGLGCPYRQRDSRHHPRAVVIVYRNRTMKSQPCQEPDLPRPAEEGPPMLGRQPFCIRRQESFPGVRPMSSCSTCRIERRKQGIATSTCWCLCHPCAAPTSTRALSRPRRCVSSLIFGRPAPLVSREPTAAIPPPPTPVRSPRPSGSPLPSPEAP